MNVYRSHKCNELNITNEGQQVRLCGWVHRIRDHGGVLFIDLRDYYGFTQILVDPDSAAFQDFEKVRSEWCIRVDGKVKLRGADLVNPKIATGEIEVFVSEVEVLSEADDLPLPVFGDLDYTEETRLKYRFLDLRRAKLQTNMVLRSKIVASIRRRMWDIGFNEFQTPIITASSPRRQRFLIASRCTR